LNIDQQSVLSNTCRYSDILLVLDDRSAVFGAIIIILFSLIARGPVCKLLAGNNDCDEKLPVLGIRHRFVSRSSKFYFPYQAILQSQNNLSRQSPHELSYLLLA